MSWEWAQRQTPGLSSTVCTQSLLYPIKFLVTPCLLFSQWHVEDCYLTIFAQPALKLHFILLCQRIISPPYCDHVQCPQCFHKLMLTISYHPIVSGRIISSGLLCAGCICIIFEKIKYKKKDQYKLWDRRTSVKLKLDLERKSQKAVSSWCSPPHVKYIPYKPRLSMRILNLS